MTAKGHVVLAATPVCALYGSSLVEHWLGIFFFFLGALLPDIDEKGSYIGRKLYFISGIFRDLGISHRGFTHFAIIPIAMMLFGYVLDLGLLIWLGAGVLMHDIGDLLTKGGIKDFWYPLFPGKTFGLLPRKYRFYTFSLTEKLVILLFFTLNMIFVTRGLLYG